MKLSKAAEHQLFLYKKYIAKDEEKELDLEPYFKRDIYTDFSDEAEYHSFVGLSQSQTKNAIRGMNNYFFKKYLDESYRKTKDMTLGDYVHKCILEPHLIDKFVFDDDCIAEILEERPETKNVRATTEYKAWKKQQDLAGKMLITREQKRDAEYMLESIYKHPYTKDLSPYSGIKEKAGLIYDEEYGLFRRFKWDSLFPNNVSCILDVKKCQDISPQAFTRDVFKFKYHVQAFDYLRLAGLKYSIAPKDFVNLAIESNAPYECAYYKMSEDTLKNGEAIFRCLIENIVSAYESKEFKISYPKLKLLSFEDHYPYAEKWVDEFLSEQLHNGGIKK